MKTLRIAITIKLLLVTPIYFYADDAYAAGDKNNKNKDEQPLPAQSAIKLPTSVSFNTLDTNQNGSLDG